MTPSTPPTAGRSRRHSYLGLACVGVAAVTASLHLGTEHYLSKHGDMPRYLMNAAFFYDLVRDHPFGSLDTLLDYARLYYARYPALSIGHHPVLGSIATIPFFAAFGVSVLAARLPLIVAFAAATLYLYRLMLEWSDEWAATAAAMAFATSPILVELSQSVMSEPFAVALLVIATYYLHRFCVTGARTPLVAFVLAAGLSVWAKQLAVLAFPGFLLYALATLGWRRLLARDVAVAGGLLTVVILPIVPLTLALSPSNVRVLTVGGPSATPWSEWWRIVRLMGEALADQFTWPLAIAGAIGLIVALWQRRPQVWLLLPQIAATAAFILMVTRSQEVSRYGVYWMPAWAAGIGFLCAAGRWRRTALTLVALLLCLEAIAVVRHRLAGAEGYEAAAKYVVDHPHGPTVMFSGDVDTGYFVFFVRKHDGARRQIVLRADKILTTSFMSRVAIEDKVKRADEIAPRLRELGVGYVVIEDRRSDSHVLEWLRSEVKSDAYDEVLRTPIESTDRRLEATDLVVYRTKGDVRPADNAFINMRLPLVSRQVDVKLSDLLSGTYMH